MTRIALSVCAFALCFAPVLSADANPLSFFKNYFVTGDYVSAGVSLRGKGVNGIATDNIVLSGVPEGADPVAAFLYWETIEKQEGQGARGKFRTFDIIGKPLGDRTSPCWSSGGGSGASNGVTSLRVYRTDVLRYLPVANGKRVANGTFQVSLVDAGTGNQSPGTNGASLVVVYRKKGDPFKAVVLYDGSLTIDNATQTLTQTIQGFYQTKSTNPVGRITYIVGDAQANFGERLLVNGNLISTDPFKGPYWDNQRFELAVGGDTGSFTTRIDHEGSSTFDCLSLGAIVFGVEVQDSDADGLLDTWEKNGFTDIAGGMFVNLPAMGANPNRKDVFIEIDWMESANHKHKPKQAALDMVSGAFQNAPGGPIQVHFDIGQGYPFNGGGNVLPETQNTLFPGEFGVVGWKSGLRAIKDVYFDHSRRDVYHYGVFAHALGLASDPATVPASTRSTSGISDLPGGDFLVTLGKWRSDNPADNQVGSVLQQAGTLMHEFGHNGFLRHGGDENTPGCKPNYQSVMNYMFQTRGLITATGATVLDYSRQDTLPLLNEGSLNEAAGIGAAIYRPRWYSPPGALDSILTSPETRFAKRHCDGSPIAQNEPPFVLVQPDTAYAGQVDWNNDGVISSSISPVDINFSGVADAALKSVGDWTALDLQQLGSRRNAKGLSGDIASGDIASGDIASGDIASGDIASGDIASGDIASGDIASGLDVDFETFKSVIPAPGNLTITASSRSNTLNWTKPSDNQVVEYWIYRAVDAINSSTLQRIARINTMPLALQYVDTDIKGGTIYLYFVTAIGVGNTQSAPSNTVTNKKK